MNKLYQKYKKKESFESYTASVTNFNKCSIAKEKSKIQIYESENDVNVFFKNSNGQIFSVKMSEEL